MLRRARVVLVVITLLLGLGASGGQAATELETARGDDYYPGIQPQVPDPYFPTDGNRGFAVIDYDLRVRYRFSDGYLSGTATIIAFSSESLRSFNLDLLLDVDSITVFDNAGDEGLEAQFEKVSRHELVVTPARPLINGDPDIVVIKYHGYPSKISWKGESNWLANEHEVVTMNRVHMAPWWFPTNEHPSDPGSFDLWLTTAKNKEVVSNGELVSRRVHGRTATTHWRGWGGIAPHLQFFAAGDFDVESGRSGHGFTYYYAVSKHLPARTRAVSMATLGKSVAITNWLQHQLGDYDYGSTGGVVTSLHPGFAVANPTRPTYSAAPSVETVFHQLAQQWFGGRVRISQWADIWLNEGFATYMKWLYDEMHGGPSTDEVLRRTYRHYEQRARFWDLTVSDPGPARLFDQRVAVRGAMTLAALRHRFGPVAMADFLKDWVWYRRGRHSSTHVFELGAEKVFEERLGGFFDTWLRDHRPPPRQSRFGL